MKIPLKDLFWWIGHPWNLLKDYYDSIDFYSSVLDSKFLSNFSFSFGNKQLFGVFLRDYFVRRSEICSYILRHNLRLGRWRRRSCHGRHASCHPRQRRQWCRHCLWVAGSQFAALQLLEETEESRGLTNPTELDAEGLQRNKNNHL